MSYLGDFHRDVAALREATLREDLFQRPRVNIVSACLIAGVSRATLYRWIQRGMVEVVRTPSGHPRIYADTLLKREPDDE